MSAFDISDFDVLFPLFYPTNLSTSPRVLVVFPFHRINIKYPIKGLKRFAELIGTIFIPPTTGVKNQINYIDLHVLSSGLSNSLEKAQQYKT